MDDRICLTQRALSELLFDYGWKVVENPEAMLAACDGRTLRSVTPWRFITSGDLHRLLHLHKDEGFRPPTCPKCAVLWDEAVTGPLTIAV